MKTHLIAASAALALMTSCSSTPRLGHDSIDDVVAAMTREEKVHLVIGTGMNMGDGDETVVGETRSLVPGAAGTTYPIERLGIPAVVLADGPAGLRIDPTREGDSATYYCTHFPIGTLLACTWDTALVAEVGRAIGSEVLEYGADVLLAPALNIHRNPLCGRNFEYYSEDPVVSGDIAAAYVKGVQSNGVGTSIKHFAANNQETNRNANDAQVSQRALREIYLKGFERCVKDAEPMTVMSSYNYINGEYASESADLLTALLRDEWGYGGMVMTDWFGGKDAVVQMKAGNDMLQPGYDKQYDMIMAALEDGTLDEEVLDRNVKRILAMIVETPRFKGYAYSNKPDLERNADVTRKSATEGMVLLKNDKGTLPFSDGVKNIAVYGCTSYDFIAGGTGSGNVNRAYTVSLLDGLRNAGYTTDDALEKSYREYIAEFEAANVPDSTDKFAAFLPKKLPDEMQIPAAELAAQAADADIALITIGRMSGEFLDRESSDFNISANNRRLIDDVCRAFHARGKKVVVVLNVGGVIETQSWKNAPDAILCAWQGGQEGGNSVADILSGKVNPSGKLTMTFPADMRDHASSANFPIDIKASTDITNKDDKQGEPVRLVDYTPYEEDIYVGYRYFDTFGKKVSYPFGYGLSYTTFEYADPSVSRDAQGDFTVRVTIRNSGDRAGKEVAQLYVTAPNARSANKPEKELKAFAKTRELAPGESQTIELRVPHRDLASFDDEASEWVVTPGSYDFLIGASSADIRAKVSAEAEALHTPAGRLLAPKAELNRLTR